MKFSRNETSFICICSICIPHFGNVAAIINKNKIRMDCSLKLQAFIERTESRENES